MNWRLVFLPSREGDRNRVGGRGGLEGCGGEGGSWVGGGKWEKGDGWLVKWDFGLVPKPWEYEGKCRGKDGRSGTLKQRDVDRWMIMGFFFFGETTVIVREGKKVMGWIDG